PPPWIERRRNVAGIGCADPGRRQADRGRARSLLQTFRLWAEGLRLAKMLGDGPPSWNEQRRKFGFLTSKLGRLLLSKYSPSAMLRRRGIKGGQQ
ncbi:MAG: hypothetical protein ACREGK_07550, partial [Geminicoccales bacterium]